MSWVEFSWSKGDVNDWKNVLKNSLTGIQMKS